MSRSGYSDDCDDGWALIRWRGAVTSAIKGERGQAFLRELRDAMDAMPEKRLIAEDLAADGCYCAMGVVAAARGVDVSGIDPHSATQVSQALGIAKAMAREIAFMNDEGNWDWNETPEQRWTRMRKWVGEQILEGEGTPA